jgi:hypothetical protein
MKLNGMKRCLWWSMVTNQLAVALLALSMVSCRTSQGQCAGQIPQRSALNPFVITYDPSKECVDLPLVDALILGAKDRNGRFARSPGEHESGVAALPGDTLLVSVYFDNGGADVPANTAKNVRSYVSVTPEVGTDHIISVRLEADNAGTAYSKERGGDIVIHTKLLTKLTYLPDTAILCITRQHALERSLESTEICGSSDVAVTLKNANLPQVMVIGDLAPGFKYSGTTDFKLKVEAVQSAAQ